MKNVGRLLIMLFISFLLLSPASCQEVKGPASVAFTLKEKDLIPEGPKAYQKVLDKPDLLYENKANGEPVIPEDLLDKLKINKKAYDNFHNFTQSARRIYIDWLNSAKKTETRTGRIEKIVSLSEKNQRPGMM